ncbi:MAG: hypothetical protein D3910_10550, partial [Candidatus Electrothrix sp. ATG2]|nr:hypothetical protein [Candidatus Electrothrix sp. ATG2]
SCWPCAWALMHTRWRLFLRFLGRAFFGVSRRTAYLLYFQFRRTDLVRLFSFLCRFRLDSFFRSGVFPHSHSVFNGTSAATPHVAGVAALILSVNPNLSATEVETILRASTDDLSQQGYDIYTGFGRINAFKALQTALLRWDSPRMIPGWFGRENQGGDIAVADISKNGRSDLLVFQIDNPGGENYGFYRIGWDLDASGIAQSWSPIKAVPGWFGAENQGVGVALADINGNGKLDLIVYHIDNPHGANHGYYRIGWDLNSDGDVTGGWSDIKSIPGWFGWESQGGGIAIADLNGDGRPEIIVFHIDNPSRDKYDHFSGSLLYNQFPCS